VYLQSYNATTGQFTTAQPSFSELSGSVNIIVGQSQIPISNRIPGTGYKVQTTSVVSSDDPGQIAVYDGFGNILNSTTLTVSNILTVATAIDYIQSFSASGTIGFGSNGQFSTLVLATAGNNGITLTLPTTGLQTAGGNIVKVIMVDKGGSSTASPPGTTSVTIASGAGQTIGFISGEQASYSLGNQNQSVTLEYVGNGQWVITATAN
jgi:hypothetical protein